MSSPRPAGLSLVESDPKEHVSDADSPRLTAAASSPFLEKPYSDDKPSPAAKDHVQISVLPPLQGQHVASAAASRKDLLVPIIMLCSSAVLPAVMGVLFYTSISFKAKNGVFYPNGTYVRPVNEGFQFGSRDSFLSTHFSPLLLSSLSSSLIGMLSSSVMGLVGYHLALRWLRSSAALTSRNLTPMQYYNLLGLISNASPMGLFRLLLYGAKKAWARWKSARTRKRGVPTILWTAGGAMLAILFFHWAIALLDVVLHSKIISTLVATPRDDPVPFEANAAIKAGCEDSVVNVCGVVNRTQEASLGGLNQSTSFRIYEHGAHVLDRQDSLAFIGPVNPQSDLAFEANTLVASTHCDVYHPHCDVVDRNTQVCWPTLGSNTSAKPDLDAWNEFAWTTGFNTSSWQTRIQTFLTKKGNLSAPFGKAAALSSGSNLNPFTTASFGCFVDNGGITYSDKNLTYPTPFINWWSYGPGLPKQPYILCSISLCNTTVYDAKYTVDQGTLTLDNSSFSLANATAAVAVSGAGMLLGSGDTYFYQWGPRFIDDQMQVDLSNAGNTYGNNTAQFSAAWAQAFSNRYLGWSAGMVELAEMPVQIFSPELALSIPVAIVYAFTVLHFVYAFGILLLGASCLVIARGDGSYRADLKDAHQRLRDASTLVQDLAEKSIGEEGGGEEERWLREESSTFLPNERGLAASTDSLKFEDSEVSVTLRRRTDGRLGLRFQREL